MQVTYPETIGQYWTWRDYRIHYVKAGHNQDRPPILFVHGFGASTDHWVKNMAGLQDEFEVWAIDLLGFGRSTKADTQYSGDLWCNQVHDFIEEVIGRPAVIVGNSIGGYVTLATNALFPESTRGAMLLNPAGGFSEERKTDDKTTPNRKNLLNQALMKLFKQDFAMWLIFKNVHRRGFIRKTLRNAYVNQSEVTDQLVENIYQPACDKAAPRAFARMFQSPPGEPVDVQLGRLKNPLFVIWGEKDPFVGDPRQRNAKYEAYYPAMRSAFVNAGHCPHDDAPEMINPMIREWVMTFSASPTSSH
jgi:pimeloyl-ACP methyl ester carboxylesterase